MELPYIVITKIEERNMDISNLRNMDISKNLLPCSNLQRMNGGKECNDSNHTWNCTGNHTRAQLRLDSSMRQTISNHTEFLDEFD